jgi:environmental stress-induced protein Ves
MPWRNGAGVTREIAIGHAPAPDAGGGAAVGGAATAAVTPSFSWRVSMADLAGDGPFSHFPGVDRVLVLLRGEGVRVRLGSAAEPVALAPLAPLAFPGEWDVFLTMTPGQPRGRDLNLMWDRCTWQGGAEVLTRSDADGSGGGVTSAGDRDDLGAHGAGSVRMVEPVVRLVTSPLAFVVAVGGPARVRVAGVPFHLDQEDTLRLDREQLEGDRAAVLVGGGDGAGAQAGEGAGGAVEVALEAGSVFVGTLAPKALGP